MKSGKKYLYSFIAILCLSGCTWFTNPTPDIIDYNTINFDEFNNPTAGLLTNTIDGYFIITPKAVDTYNQLIDLYGEFNMPKLKRNDGLIKTPDGKNYLIDSSHIRYFMDMADLYKLNKINK